MKNSFMQFDWLKEQFRAIWLAGGTVSCNLIGRRKGFTLQKFMSRNLRTSFLSSDFKMCNNYYRDKVEIIRDELFNGFNK